MVRRGLALWIAVMPSLALAACDWFAYDDNSAPPATGPEGGYDTTVPRDATGGVDASHDAGEGGGDALEEGLDGGGEAESDADAAVVGEAGGCSACPCGCFDGSCTSALNAIGPAAATAGGQTVTLAQTSPNGASTGGGPVSHTNALTVTTTTAPGGSAQSVGLAWAINDPTVPPGSSSITMTISSSTSTADTWTGTIPAQAAGSEVYFYTFAVPYNGCGQTIYDPTNFVHYAYAVN